jgi:molybdenum cofactor synthesis domain-containing protein
MLPAPQRRSPGYPRRVSGLLPYAEALALVVDACRPTPVEEVGLDEAAGRVLAAPVRAREPVPPFANSAMDGFAVRAAELASGPAALPLREGGAAGRDPEPLGPGTAARVATGAPLPAGADAVVPIEDAEVTDGRVRLPGGVAPGRFVRAVGSDLGAGATGVRAGRALGPAEGALLAALGAVQVPVHRRPRVAILSSGAELVPPETTTLGPAMIRDANGTALAWACRAAGADVVPLGIAPDEPEGLRALLARGLEADALVSSAGVSVGERDLVREVHATLGVKEVFWGVDLKPGKPGTFGVRDGVPVLGLPGNPASALVGFTLFVRPALRALAGWAEPAPRPLEAIAAGTWPAPERRAHAVRCAVTADGRVAPTGDQGSHRIASLVGADVLAMLEPGRTVTAGEAVRVIPTGWA